MADNLRINIRISPELKALAEAQASGEGFTLSGWIKRLIESNIDNEIKEGMKMELKEWSFENGIKVMEDTFNYDLHCFKVFYQGRYLGTIYPDTLEQMDSMKDELDEGTDPIEAGWEDALGRCCSLEGWADDDY